MAELTDEGIGGLLGKYYTTLRIGPYERPKPFNGPVFAPTLLIALPIPNELRDDTQVSYSSQNLETVGDLFNLNIGSGAGAALLRNSGNLITAAGGVVGDALAAAAGAATQSNAVEQVVSGAANAIGSLFPAEQITSAIQQSIGVAPNPNPSVQFQGPVLRDFSYTWAFYPKSRAESEKIQRMIGLLKARALPKNIVKDSGALLKYPDICQINFYPWDSGGNDNPWGWSSGSILKYKKAFMQSVNVNYNPFGTPAFFEGTHLPVSYQLTISFREIEYLLSNDWESSRAGDIADTAEAVSGQISSAATNAGVGAALKKSTELTGAGLNADLLTGTAQ